MTTKVRIVGISEPPRPLLEHPAFIPHYSEAVNFTSDGSALSFPTGWCDRTRRNAMRSAANRVTTGLRADNRSSVCDCILYYLKNTGNTGKFRITITIALMLGPWGRRSDFLFVDAGNLKQFGALKAIGVTQLRTDSAWCCWQAFYRWGVGFGLVRACRRFL